MQPDAGYCRLSKFFKPTLHLEKQHSYPKCTIHHVKRKDGQSEKFILVPLLCGDVDLVVMMKIKDDAARKPSQVKHSQRPDVQGY